MISTIDYRISTQNEKTYFVKKIHAEKNLDFDNYPKEPRVTDL